MLYTIAGEGKLFYENKEYTLTENDLMVIDCRKPHKYYSPIGLWEHAYFDFTGLNTQYLTQKLNDISAVISLSPLEKEHFFNIIDLFFKTDENFNIIFNKECITFFTELLLHKKVQRNDISKGIEYIESNFRENIPAHLPARLCNMSEGTFCRKFKKTMGTTPHGYMIKLRVEYAAQMLISNSNSISEISEMAGFYDQNHLIRHFKKLTGITPAKYREKRTVL